MGPDFYLRLAQIICAHLWMCNFSLGQKFVGVSELVQKISRLEYVAWLDNPYVWQSRNPDNIGEIFS